MRVGAAAARRVLAPLTKVRILDPQPLIQKNGRLSGRFSFPRIRPPISKILALPIADNTISIDFIFITVVKHYLSTTSNDSTTTSSCFGK